MEGNDSTQTDRDRASPVKNVEIGNPNPSSGVVDSVSSEWTNEKHNLYLSSIEATFVNQLYARGHFPTNLMGLLSRTQKKTNLSQLSPDKPHSDQFKVLRKGCWEDFKFDRAKSQAVAENEPRHILANSWVQRFKASTGNLPQTSVDAENNDLSSRSMNLNSPTDVKRTSAKHLPDCYPLMFHHGSVSSQAEVTDQNFVDTEYNKVEEEPRKSSSRKRSRRSTYSKITDQIVPCNSVGTSSLRSGSLLKEKEAKFGTIKSEPSSSYHYEEPQLGFRFYNG